ncbi:hypothetical protein BGY98DRAFT_1044267 [Russula aff. rugulosa BPL654]|nr:hypothetical protein BGY98DRAFT_1044267 [Russula aff. rugulosa BPL654]
MMVMDGWYGFRAQVSITMAKGKRSSIISSEREMGLYGTLLKRSRRYFWHSRYFWDAG